MGNCLFSPENIKVLKDICNIRLIASDFPDEVEPLVSPKHKQWARKHAHAHSTPEMAMVLKGCSYQQLNDKTYPMTPGNVIMFDSMDEHQFGGPLWNAGSEELWIAFLPGLAHVHLLSMEKRGRRAIQVTRWAHFFPLPIMGLSSPRILFPNPKTKAPEEVQRERCLGALHMFFSALTERSYSVDRDFPKDSLQGSVIRSIVKHIQETYGRNCSLENLARLAGYSPCHFSRLFSQHAGMSLLECVNGARTTGFRKMLGEGKALKAIAVELGFSHASGLSRWRRQHGI